MKPAKTSRPILAPTVKFWEFIVRFFRSQSLTQERDEEAMKRIHGD